MQAIWITILYVTLMAIGTAAQFTLLRSFLRDWRESRIHRRDRRRNSLSQVKWPGTSMLSSITPRLAVAFLIAPAKAEPMPLAGEHPAPWAALTFQTPLIEQPQIPNAEPPLTISTNRPSFNDTSGIVPLGHFQLETGYTFTYRNRDGIESQTHNGPELLGRIALLDDRMELQIGTSGRVWSRSDTGVGFDTTEGFSDVSIGLRLKITDQDGCIPRMALQASTTTGIGTDGISNQDVEPTLKFIWSYDLGEGWGLYGNLACAYLTADTDRFFQGQAGVCLTKVLSEKWSIYGEYYVFGPNSKDTDAAHYTDVGAAYLVTPRIQLDARIGSGLNEEANNLFIGFGISFLF